MKQKVIYKKQFKESPFFDKKMYVGEITPFMQEPGKYEVYVRPHNDINKGFIVTIFKGKSQKPYSHRLYSDMKKAGIAIDEIVEAIKKDYEAKEIFKKEKKNRAKLMFEKIKVGDIFFTSWGYDQTNVDFFQIIEKGQNNVVAQEIAKQEVPKSQSFMSARVRPVKDQFIGNPFIAKVTQFGIIGGKISKFSGEAAFYTYGNDGVYSSWYA